MATTTITTTRSPSTTMAPSMAATKDNGRDTTAHSTTSSTSSDTQASTATTTTSTFLSTMKTWQQRVLLGRKQHGLQEQQLQHKEDNCPSTTSNHATWSFDDAPDDPTLHLCLNLLSSSDIDLNRVGLQRLTLLTRGRTVSTSSSSSRRSHVLVGDALLYGGPLGSVQDRLRYVFATTICDAPHEDCGTYRPSPSVDCLPIDVEEDDDDDDNGRRLEALYVKFCHLKDHDDLHNDDLDQNKETAVVDPPQSVNDNEDRWDSCSYSSSSSFSSSSSSSSCELDCGPQGKSWGALHNLGLRVLANALSQQVQSSKRRHHDERSDDNDDDDEGVHNRRLPLDDTIWRSLLRSLCHDIESNHTADSTGYALRIIRLLHTIHPDVVQPLLERSLFPHLVYLQGYGERHLFPMIQSESTYLLRRIQVR